MLLFSAAGGEIFNLCLPDVEEIVEETDIIRLMRQILEGICHLHRNNIVHLDLKVILPIGAKCVLCPCIDAAF